MKQIVYFLKMLIIILVLSCVNVLAKENYTIDSVYINSEIDLMGSQHITELIITKGKIDNFEIILDYENPNKRVWKEKNIDYKDSSFYSGRSINISKISSFTVEKNIDWNLLNYKCDQYKKVDKYDNKKNRYTETKDGSKTKIRIYNSANEGYTAYLLDYYVNQTVVFHNDIAELNWYFIGKDFMDIDNLHIQVLTPGNTKKPLFKFWGHGSLKGEISGIVDKKDKTIYKGILLNASDIKSGNGFNIRLTFDKSNLMGFCNNILNNSKQDALNEIIRLENDTLSKSDKTRSIFNVFKYSALIIIILYIISLFSIILYIRIVKLTKTMKNINLSKLNPLEMDYIYNKKITIHGCILFLCELIKNKKIKIKVDENDLVLFKTDLELSESENNIINIISSKNKNITIEKEPKINYKNAKRMSDIFNDLENYIQNSTSDYFKLNTEDYKVCVMYTILGFILLIINIFINKDIMSIVIIIIILAILIMFLLITKLLLENRIMIVIKMKKIKRRINKHTTIINQNEYIPYMIQTGKMEEHYYNKKELIRDCKILNRTINKLYIKYNEKLGNIRS